MAWLFVGCNGHGTMLSRLSSLHPVDLSILLQTPAGTRSLLLHNVTLMAMRWYAYHMHQLMSSCIKEIGNQASIDDSD